MQVTDGILSYARPCVEVLFWHALPSTRLIGYLRAAPISTRRTHKVNTELLLPARGKIYPLIGSKPRLVFPTADELW